MSGNFVLVTGGARSGKSSFAEKYASSHGDNIAYIATAQIWDDEMRTRVELHRKRRPATWQTYEAPFEAEKAVIQAQQHADVILIDCLTVYTSNLLIAAEKLPSSEERSARVLSEFNRLLNAINRSKSIVIAVTNEVGMGIVPDNPLAREYRDIAGWVNQKAAACANEVFLVVSGLPVEIKKLALNH